VSTRAQRNIRGQKRRLFRIALLTTICLLVQGTITILISSTLEEWNDSSEAWLYCTLHDNGVFRNWELYGHTDGDVVCTDTDIDRRGLEIVFGLTLAQKNPLTQDVQCTSDCIFNDLHNRPVCDVSAYVWNEVTHTTLGCICSCDDIVQIEKPSVLAMTLSHLAQSLVVAIVGLNMGLR
jgi:hypothetical protein